MTADHPQVGIFWFVVDAAGLRHMIAKSSGLQDAEPYGDCLTFPMGHHEVWETWKRAGHTDAKITVIVKSSEYDDWPRGRVVFDGGEQRFFIYADRRITQAGLIPDVARHFHLTACTTITRHDVHYSTRS